jgi:hypothetical protein
MASTEERARTIDGLVVGLLLRVDADGTPHVVFPGNPSSIALAARSTQRLKAEDVGSEVALSFESGDPSKPIVLGKILRPDLVPMLRVPPDTAEVDGRTIPLEITAEREIVLRCGKASITLTREGKIILRGTYISSRSSGVNRIKGGSVQLN